MSYITATNLCRNYRRRVKRSRYSLVDLLVPTYEQIFAVHDLNFSIGKGEMAGLIGLNGAGKSTTMKLLTGVLVPTSGSLTVGGDEPHKNRMKHNKKMGAVFGQRSQLWWDVPVIDSYRLLQKIYGVAEADFRTNLEYFTAQLSLGELLNVPLRLLSLGQKMRCEIAAAFLHSPEVVFLDEPTIGLDFRIKKKIREFVLNVNRQYNTTIVLTTHDLGDIEELCNRILVIDAGKILYDGSQVELKKNFGAELELDIFSEGEQRVFDVLKTQPGIISILNNAEGGLTVRFDRDKVPAAEIIGKIAGTVSVTDIRLRGSALENIIEKFYQGQPGDSA